MKIKVTEGKIEEIEEEEILNCCFLCDEKGDYDCKEQVNYCSEEHRNYHHPKERDEPYPFLVKYRSSVGR